MRIEFDFIRKHRIRKWTKRVEWHWKFAFFKRIGPRKFMILEWYGERFPPGKVYWKVCAEGEPKKWDLNHKNALDWVRHGVEMAELPTGQRKTKRAWIEDISRKTYSNMKDCKPDFCFKEDLATDENGVLYHVKEAMDELDGRASDGTSPSDPLGQRRENRDKLDRLVNQ